MIHFDPYSLDFHDNPYPVYKQLRDEAPVYFHEALNIYAISRYEDVVEAHRDNEAFSSRGGVQIEPAPHNMSLIMKDNPEHRWHKALATKVFTRDRMAAMEGYIRQLCRDLLDKCDGKAEIDLVNDFAVQLPMTVISEMIGIPEQHRAQIHHSANMMLLRAEADPAEIKAAKIAGDAAYAQLAKDRRANPGDDIITMFMTTELTDDHGVVRYLSDEELSARFSELAIAGHETVSKAIPNGAVALQQFPSERAKLLANPRLIANAVEEILRFDPPSQLQGRTTTRDYELHGVTIPKGYKTMLLTGAATRDERRFENPDVFDVERENDIIAIYFGYGIHRCLGMHLARLEVRIAFEELLARYPEFEVFPERSRRMVLSNVRGMSYLPCRLGARRA
jgi:cytochrome P450